MKISLASFLNNTAGLSDSEFIALQQQAKAIINGQVIKAYKDYWTFFNTEDVPGARSDIGISSSPSGEAFYANRAKYYTTTQMTPKEIHELGLAEVPVFWRIKPWKSERKRRVMPTFC